MQACDVQKSLAFGENPCLAMLAQILRVSLLLFSENHNGFSHSFSFVRQTKIGCASERRDRGARSDRPSEALFARKKPPSSATSTEVLKDAMDHPEKYPDLVVRVSGFSALYVALAREVQMDILARTQQE